MTLVPLVIALGRSRLVRPGNRKMLVFAAIAVTGGLGVFAQGTIYFNNLTPSVRTHIYAPLASDPERFQIGNGISDFPPGTTSWAEWTPIGAAGNNVQYGANTTLAALLAAPGLNQPESSLQPATAGGVTSFRSGDYAGFIQGTVATFNNIPPDYAQGATVEMVVWDNSSGNYPAWTESLRGGALVAFGSSGRLNMTAPIGGLNHTPPSLPNTLRSFNLGRVPEPSTFALVGLGAAMLMILRRRAGDQHRPQTRAVSGGGVFANRSRASA